MSLNPKSLEPCLILIPCCLRLLMKGLGDVLGHRIGTSDNTTHHGQSREIAVEKWWLQSMFAPVSLSFLPHQAKLGQLFPCSKFPSLYFSPNQQSRDCHLAQNSKRKTIRKHRTWISTQGETLDWKWEKWLQSRDCEEPPHSDTMKEEGNS